MTVRGIFYALVSAGIVPKDDTQGYRPVQRQVLELRRQGDLPWAFVADGTRWMRQVTTFDGVDDALAQTVRLYRRDLWASQDYRLEVWLEKDALADLLWPLTSKWGVPLAVSKGVPSATYLYNAAQDSKAKNTIVLCFYDHDAGGQRAFDTVERGFDEYGGFAIVDRVALNEWQIAEHNLPTRPAKRSDPQAKAWGDKPAVELDAMPPDVLLGYVERAITSWVDERAWKVAEAIEAEERAGLRSLLDRRAA
jgi:hypothetical protein